MIIHGKDIIIMVNGRAIAAARSCEIDVKTDLLEVSSPTTGKAHTFIPGRYTWTLTTSHLLIGDTGNTTPVRTFIRRSIVNNTVSLVINDNDYTNDTLTGTAICHNARITATQGNLAQGSLAFQGNSELE
jgi:hypothetical protein